MSTIGRMYLILTICYIFAAAGQALAGSWILASTFLFCALLWAWLAGRQR